MDTSRQMSDGNFHAKFGYTPPNPLVVIVGHFVLSILVLLVIQPPFVQRSGSVHLPVVVFVAFMSSAFTYALFLNDVSPVDTFRGVVEHSHRIMELTK